MTDIGFLMVHVNYGKKNKMASKHRAMLFILFLLWYLLYKFICIYVET